MTQSARFGSCRAKAVARRAGSTLIVAALAAVGSVGPARAAMINYAATIDGAQETPPMVTPAMASGTFVMDTVAKTMSVNIVMPVPPPSGEVAAHIHGYVPPGVPGPIIFPLPLGSPKIAVWNYPPANENDIINGLTYANVHSAANLGGEIRGQILRVPSCGDGIIDAGEQCDDGNNVSGDCCDASCQLEPDGAACTGDGLCASNSSCDGLGHCLSQPVVGCKTAGKAVLLVKNETPDSKDKMLFKWVKGPAYVTGSPTTTTSYALCLYAGTTALASAEVPPSATLWSQMSPPDALYNDPARSQDGIAKILLKNSASAGKAKAIIKGKGDGLPDPPTGPLTPPITAQLVNSVGECLEGVFSGAGVIKNDATQFKAKAP